MDVKDAGGQAIGFLLGSLGVSVALTSDICYKGLPKGPTGDVASFRGSFLSHRITLELGECNMAVPVEYYRSSTAFSLFFQIA